jgi:hypothetical protein
MSKIRFVVFCLLPIAPALPLYAQNFGEVNGTVTDPSGGVVANATVAVVNTATNSARIVQTNATGNYNAPFLVPGVYRVQAELQGFKVASRTGVVLEVGAVMRIDFTMEVGVVSETVAVSASGALLATEGTAIGTVVDNRRIVDMPLNGRNYLQLIALSPSVTHEMAPSGTATGRLGGERASQNFSIAGQRMEFNHYTLDGIENTDPQWQTFIIRPSVDALQEFKVESGIYSAEFGRNPGQVSVTTKSGSNAFHGTVFEFLRNSAMDAREWRQATTEKNPFHRNQYGFTLGGRLIRDRLFFLSNFEGSKDRKTLQEVSSVATARMRSGDFAGQSRGIFDYATRTFTSDAAGNRLAVSALQFPLNAIPASRLSPIAKKLLEFYPDPTVPGDNINRNWNGVSNRRISSELFSQRIDFNENTKSFWFGRFGWGDEYVQPETLFPDQQGRILTKTYQTMVSNTRILSPSAVNEFRFGYTQFQNDSLPHFGNVRDVSSELGIVGLRPPPAAWGGPSIGLGNGLSGFGESTDGPYTSRNHIFQWLDSVSVTRGKHAIKFGGELRRERINIGGNGYNRSLISFGSNTATYNPANRTATGFAFADFMLGQASSFESADALASTLLRATPYAAYVEDVWKVTPKLTVNIGLRYELTPPYEDKYRGVMSVNIFDPGVGPNGKLPNSRQPVLIRGGSGDFYEGAAAHYIDSLETVTGDGLGKVGIPNALVLTDRNDFAPRLGIAYNPSGKWTIRSGIGIFYAHDQSHYVFEGGKNLAGRVATYSSDAVPSVSLADPTAQDRANALCRNWTGPCQGTGTLVFSIDPRIRTPRVTEWVLDIQRQLTNNLVLEAGYTGNEGHKLQRARQRNQAILRSSAADATTFDQRRPWPGFPGRLQDIEGDVNANYNAANVKLTQRFSHGLTYMVGYTWGKSIDSGSGVRPGGGDAFDRVTSYDDHRERALSQFDTHRRMVASILYELPVGPGKSFLTRGGAVLGKIVGGWQVGSILTFSDGTPVGAGTIGDTNNRGEIPNVSDATGISPFPSNPTVTQFWNIAAFNATNPELTVRLGNIGRNVLRTPGTNIWDFSLVKNTRIREGHMLEFRFEGFNFANHPNWTSPSTAVTSPTTFGVINTAKTMREMQVALKYSF